jgi:hypothetical protein
VSLNEYSSEYLEQGPEVESMDTEAYSSALKNALNEVQNICPDIKSVFLFNEEGQIIAGAENTPEAVIIRAMDALDGLIEKAEAIDSVESISFEASKGRVNVSRISDLYLVTLASEKADMNYVGTVTRVIIPAVIKLLDKIAASPLKDTALQVEAEPEDSTFEEAETTSEEPAEEIEKIEREEQAESEAKSEPILPEAPVNQFIVENMGGVFVSADTVRIDNEVLLKWKELYEDRAIEEAEIETFGGKSTRCKLKPIKDSKHEGKGIIQMPEKIQAALDIRKGELVRVKPVVE